MERLSRLLGFTGMVVGGWVGWMLGAPVSLFVAILAGIVGTGLGLYAGRLAADRLL